MFVKIKLEPQSSKALSPLKNITYFPVDDDATVITLKKEIEQYVKVPAESQEIRTLTKSFSNSRKVKEIFDAKGASIMLYAYDELSDYDKGQFVCFLQIYNDEIALQQQEMEQRTSYRTATADKSSTANSSSSSITLVADSESECSSGESESETASSNDCSEINSDDSSVESDNSICPGGGKKRSKNFKNIKNHKKLKSTTVINNLSPTLCKYLDEFPTLPSESKSNMNQGHRENNSPTMSTTTNADTKIPPEVMQKHQPEEIAANKTPVPSNALSRSQYNVTSTTTEVCHPCHAINPENRQYIVAVSKNDSTINKIHCEKLLEWFFDRFRSCETSAQLQFENNSAISLFEGKLWIACLNKQTFEWVRSCLHQCTIESFKIESLTESNHLVEVVIPQVSNNKNLLDIFHLLEQQNNNLSTLKWSVTNRKILLPEDKNYDSRTVSAFCTNELLCISLDAASKELLEKVNLKLKYCFWQIVFQFVNM